MDAPDAASGRLALIVNPIAGMGGAVALKGTDGKHDEAVKRGATPVARDRAARFLARLPDGIEVLTCQAPMGAGIGEREMTTVVRVPEPTSADDTRRAAGELVQAGIELLVFVGGDGTALDVAEAVDDDVVCLGVPSGVKMHSAVFAESPEAAADVARAFVAGELEATAAEVMELDEDAMVEGAPAPVQLATLLVPTAPAVVAGKAEVGGSVESLVEAVEDLCAPGRTLVLGPGASLAAVKRALVGKATPLGVDVIACDRDGRPELVAMDADRARLDGVPDDAMVIVSPIGGQGFVLGRGNQQVGPELIRRVGWDRLIVLATPDKLRTFEALRIDTGEPSLDAEAPERLSVLTGPGFRTSVAVRTGLTSDM